MGRLVYIPDKIIDQNGIADGATVYVYASGTTTPISIYSDSTLTTRMANPFTVDAGATFPAVYYNTSLPIKLRIISASTGAIDEYDPYDPIAAATSTGLPLSPRDFGAAGDGATDDKAALITYINFALANGLPIDGGTFQYGVNGELDLSGLVRPHIKRLRLKQLNPTLGKFILNMTDCDEIRIDALDVDVGSSPAIGDMSSTGGLKIVRGAGHRIRNVDATGQGKVTYVFFWDCKDSLFENITVHDGLFNDSSVDGTDPRLLVADDTVQGILMNDCYRCSLVTPMVRSLHGNATYYTQSGYNAVNPLLSTVVAVPYFRSRGICGGGNVQCSVVNPVVYDVEQAMDFSGNGNNWGNRGVTIFGGELVNVGSVGVKFANCHDGNMAIGTKVRNVGFYGFLLTGQTQSSQGRDSSFVNCECTNVGYNDLQFDTDAEGVGVPAYSGFYVASLPGITDGGVVGAVIKNCRAVDKQGFYLATDDSPWALAGATSATLAEPWTGYTGAYPNAVFNTSIGTETRTVTLTNGSTVISWTTGLTGDITQPYVSRPHAMQYGALCEAPYVAGSLKPNICEGLISVGHVKAAQKGFQRFHCEVTGSGTITLANNTGVMLDWDTEVEDTVGMHVAGGSDTNITAPVAGEWRIRGRVIFDSAGGATGYRRIEIQVNGTTKVSIPVSGVSGENTAVQFDEILTLAAGDNVVIRARQTSGISIIANMTLSNFVLDLVRQI